MVHDLKIDSYLADIRDKSTHIMFDLNVFGDLEDEFLTEGQVGSLITFNRLTEIMGLVGTAMGKVYQKTKKAQ